MTLGRSHTTGMKSKVHPTYKTQYRIANCPAYNQTFVRRGDVTVWLSSEAIAACTPRRSGRRGGQRRYSDLAIETALTLRLVYHLPLRHAEGFLYALFGMMRLDLSAPDYTTLSRRGIDAPMCQDTRSGGLNDLLASAEIGHDALVDLSRKEAFEAPDDLAFGSAIGGASGDVVAGGLVESHADDDGAIEGGVGVAVAASIEAVPAGGHPGRGRDRARAAELRERGFRTNPVGVIAEDDQQLGRGVGAHTEALAEGRCCLGREAREVLVVYRNFLGERDPAAGKRPERVLGGCSERIDGARSESGAAREQAVVGEVVEGFSQFGRGVHDDLLQRVHRRGARLHRRWCAETSVRRGPGHRDGRRGMIST